MIEALHPNWLIDWTDAAVAFETSSSVTAASFIIGGTTFSGDTISCPDALMFKVSNDNDDYIQFETVSDVPWIKAIGANLKITAAGGTIDFDDDNLTTSGDVTCDELTVTRADADWKFGGVTGQAALWLGCQAANTNSLFRMYSTTGDGGDYCVFYTWGYGSITQRTNYHGSFFGWHAGAGHLRYEFATFASGDQTAKAFSAYTGTNTNQLLLQTDGDIMLATIPTGATAVAAGVAANELWVTSGHATLPDGVVMRA